MKGPRFLISVLVLAALGAVAAMHRASRLARASGPMTQQCYIWQRAWTPAVVAAVQSSSPARSADVVLAAEASFRAGQLRIVKVSVDYAALNSAGRPAGLALRIGPYSGSFATNDAMATQLADLAAGLMDDWKNHGHSPSELQIDFDCAESHLAGYRHWIEAIGRKVEPTPVTITVLPSWLNSSAFAPLARLAPNYVLQVHSLRRPTSVDAPMNLCDSDAARKAVERAGKIGVPFRVALPTYGYFVAFDAGGQFVGLSAEGPSLDWPADTRIRTLRADPAAMAALIRQWTNDRPSSMTGIIWYRLPVAGDTLNWRTATLTAVMGGRAPMPSLHARVIRTEPSLAEIWLDNDGDADAPLNVQVAVHCPPDTIAASDALGGFEKDDAVPQLVFRAGSSSNNEFLPPGDRRAIGWVRLVSDMEVQADVLPNHP